MKYEILDDSGVWYEINGFQYAALLADGISKERLRATKQ